MKNKRLHRRAISRLKILPLTILVYLAGSGNVYAIDTLNPAAGRTWTNARIGQNTADYMQIITNGNVNPSGANSFLQWDRFDLGAGQRVEFVQPGPNHIALNRIYGDRSVIDGAIDGNGRIYLLNNEGFLFGPNSRINVQSLIASSIDLNFDEDNAQQLGDFINNGLPLAGFTNNGLAAFSGGAIGDIELMPGAEIKTLDGGSVMLFAPRVVNGGNIETPGGQSILGASHDTVYLTPSLDPMLRGFLIEVGNGGEVINNGRISSERGNITLAGLAINQNGLLQATTSVNENGSIRLLARDNAQIVPIDDSRLESVIDIADFPYATSDELILGVDLNEYRNADGSSITEGNVAIASRTGDVVLGEGSKIEIRPEVILVDNDDGTQSELTVPDEQQQIASRVEITGNSIVMESNAEIVAPSAEVIVHATDNAQLTAVNYAPASNDFLRGRVAGSDTRIEMHQGARIDVSGTTDTHAAMERNQLEIQLTGNFLRDAPQQREGELRNQRVNVDIRNGTPLGDVASLEATEIKRGISERMSDGGEVHLISQGIVDLSRGSEIDISGGAVNYDAGYVNTSQLVTDTGRLVDISDADIGQTYIGLNGVVLTQSSRWGEERAWRVGTGGRTRYYDSYVSGQDGGQLNILFQGGEALHALVAGSVGDPYARSEDDMPSGGEYSLTLGRPYVIGGSSQSVWIDADQSIQQVDDALIQNFLDGAERHPDFELQVSDAQINSGISRFRVRTANGNVEIRDQANIDMQDNASFSVSALNINAQGDIHSVGGDVTLNATDSLRVNSRIDVSGRWQNDNPELSGFDPYAAAVIDGGTITLSAGSGGVTEVNGDLTVTGQASLLVNGGAWLHSDGVFSAGNGGRINIRSNLDVNNENQLPALVLDGDMQAYSMARGGILDIRAHRIRIDEKAATLRPGEQLFTPAFFQRGGFSDYRLTSQTDDLVVATRIQPRVDNLLANSGYRLRASSDSLFDVARIGQLPEYLRTPTSLQLSGNLDAGFNLQGGGVRVNDGARIDLQSGARLGLDSVTHVVMNGDIVAHGGEVNLAIENDSAIFGYDAQRGIWVNGSIDVSAGYLDLPENDDALLRRQVFDAGQVNMQAGQGYIVLSEDSRIDVSGDAFDMDVPSQVTSNHVSVYRREAVAGQAGTLNLTAAEGIFVAGDIDAQAAPVAGSGGGELSVSLDVSSREPSTGTPNSSQARVINLVQNDAQLPDVPLPSVGVANAYIGQAWLSNETLQRAGFDRLVLESNNNTEVPSIGTGVIALHGGVDLNMGRSIEMYAPIVRGVADGGNRVDVSAPYIRLGSPLYNNPQVADSASAGSVDLNLNAGLNDKDGLLELSGHLRMQGFDSINLNSNGDVRLRGVQAGSLSTQLNGSFYAWSDVNIHADQLYATTFSRYAMTLNGDPNAVLNIQGRGEAAPVLSAGSSLTLTAPVIRQHGVVRAPLGEIVFGAQQLELGSDSLTSVSADDQLIPYGSTLGQERWIYPVGREVSSGNPVYSEIQAPPEKRVTLDADRIDFADGAVIDVSGGGDLYSWEFVPGIGGSNDRLSQTYSEGSFAIIPGASSYAPFDAQYWNGSDVQVGQSIYLQENDQLAAGEYTVMPARYALLPGAYLITPQDVQLLPGQRFTRVDGVQVVPGRLMTAGTDVHEQFWQGYAVEDGNRVRRYSEYFEATANPFFYLSALQNDKLPPVLPVDAGAVDILAGNQLNLAGSLRSRSVSMDIEQSDGSRAHIDGRGSQVNIAGNDLRVVDVKDNSGGIELLSDNLNNMNADSILLGGLRQRSEAGTQVSVVADSIRIENGADVRVPDLVLVANNSIALEDGSTLQSQGDAGIQDSRFIVGGGAVNGAGALLRVSGAKQAELQRINETAGRGDIVINAGAHVQASASAMLDASRDVAFDGDIAMQGGSLYLGSSRLALNGDAGAPGLNLSQSLLQQFQVDELVLNSRSSIDLYGSLDFSVDHLLLNAYTLDGYGSGDKVISAARISFGNSNGVSIPAGAAGDHAYDGSGNLQLLAGNDQHAGEVSINGGDFNIRGFNDVDIRASRDISAEADGRLDFDIAGNLVLDAGRITAAAGVEYQVDAANADLTLLHSSNFAQQNSDRQLAASLQFHAQNILHQGYVDLASGEFLLTAENSLQLGSSASDADTSITDLSGISRAFSDQTVYTSGGALHLRSVNGDVQLLASSIIDVSAGADEQLSGSAGRLVIDALQGAFTIDGAQLLAVHGADARGGRFEVDAQTLTGLDHRLLNVNGFNDRRWIRQRSGDMQLAAADTILAHDVLLQADNGQIDVAGMIDASGEQGGEVRLAADGDVNLLGGAQILAHARSDDNVTDGDGGYLYMETRNGYLNLEAGATIDVSGEAEGGKIHLRAPRTAGNDGIQLAGLDASITGFRRLDLEGFTRYSDSSVTAGDLTTPMNEAQAFMAAVNVNFSGVDVAESNNIHLRPGIEFASTGNMTIAALDLVNNRFSYNGRDEAPVLSFYAPGNLSVNGNISDAFVSVFDLVLSTEFDRLQAGESSSLRLVAGSDSGAAYSLSVLDGTGNLNVGNQLKIRTGSGDIDLVSGAALNLGRNASVYTAGRSDGRGGYNDGVNPALFDEAVELFPGYSTTVIDWSLLPGAEFPIDGGDIRIDVGGDIVSAGYDSKLVSDWIYRLAGNYQGGATASITYGEIPLIRGINFTQFRHGIGALGGGDVRIRGQGDVSNLVVSVPTNEKFVGHAASSLDTSTFLLSLSFDDTDTELRGGGDIDIEVNGDLISSQLQVDKGALNVYANGDIGDASLAGSGLYLLTGDTQTYLNAGGDVIIQAVNNVGMLPYSLNQYSDMSLSTTSLVSYSHYYSLYTPGNRINLLSLGGDIILRNDDLGAWEPTHNQPQSMGGDGISSIYPGSLLAAAVSGDIRIDDNTYLWGSPQGQLTLMADQNILGNTPSDMFIAMLDRLPESLPSRDNLLLGSVEFAGLRQGNYPGINFELQHEGSLVHANDDQPVRVIANHGDIRSNNNRNSLRFYLPKKARFYAGRDIAEVNIEAQNLNPDDQTVIQAGRDIRFINTQTLGLNITKPNRIRIGGPGEVFVLAGRNIALGNQRGINMAADIDNPILGSEGADAYVLAGLGDESADYDTFLQHFFSVDNGYELDRLLFYLQDQNADMSEQDIEAYRQTFLALSPEQQQQRVQQAKDVLLAMPVQQQHSFALRGLFNEIRQSSIRAAQEQNRALAADDTRRFGYTRGLDAIEALFPGSVLASATNQDISSGDQISLVDGNVFNVSDDDLVETGGYRYVIPRNSYFYRGDIKLTSSAILSEGEGSDLFIMAPGGELNVGLSIADNSGNNNIKGLVTRGDGDINVLALNNVAVNQSRIQALNGGDISIWSSRGDIDAGRGAKTSLSLPPARIIIDSNGDIQQIFDAAVQGSGIRTAAFSAGRDPGDVYLAAVSGVIDAGDAGIAAGGNLTLATDTLLNSDNVEAGGDSIGVPAESAGVAVDLGSMDVSNSSGDGSAQTELVAQDASDRLGAGAIAILQVEVMGLSEDPQQAPQDTQPDTQ